MIQTARSIAKDAWNYILLLIKLPVKLEPFVYALIIVYQAFMIYFDSPLWYLHLTLLILLAVNLIFRLLLTQVYEESKKVDRPNDKKLAHQKSLKSILKTEKKIYKITTHIIRAFIIGTCIYSIVIEVTVIKILITAFITIEWILEILLLLIMTILEKKFSNVARKFVKTARNISTELTVPFHEVTDSLKTTYRNVKGVFSKPNDTPSKTNDIIDADFVEIVDADEPEITAPEE